MNGNNFIYLDGNFFSSDVPLFLYNNRAFRYGDGFFETIRVVNKKICFVDAHMQRIKRAILLMGYEYPVILKDEFLSDEISKLLEKNNINGDARVRVTFFRKEGGYYTPLTNDASLLIEADSLSEDGYQLNIKGLIVDIFSDYKKPKNALSSIKTANSLIHVLAGVYKIKKQLDDCIIANDTGNIIEAINSNIFAVKNGVLYTPPIEEGCVNGIMREQILRIAKQNRISVYEVELKMNTLLNSDEVFFTNAIQGVQWVGGYKAKRYYNTTAKFFVEKLNQLVSD